MNGTLELNTKGPIGLARRRSLFWPLPHFLQLQPRHAVGAVFAHIAKLSKDDCLAISRTPLEPTIGHLRNSLQTAIENDGADSQKTEAYSDEERGSDSSEMQRYLRFS